MSMQELELKQQAQRIHFAIGEETEKRIPFAVTGEMIRAKDGTLFVSNLRDIVIDGTPRKAGDSFLIDDNGVEATLRVKLSISDSRKTFTPRAEKLGNNSVASAL